MDNYLGGREKWRTLRGDQHGPVNEYPARPCRTSTYYKVDRGP